MYAKKSIYRSGAWLGAIAMAASLVACGGGSGSSAPDPLQPYRNQALQWAPCDASILGQTNEELTAVWQELGDRLQCSTMRAPMDWAKPERSDVFVGVMRVAASEPAQRQGAVLFNPGGPGEDGLRSALRLFSAFNNSNPESAQGAMQLRLLARYDMVGFSPRGTGGSTRLNCATNELERPAKPSAVGVSDESLDNRDYNDRKTAEACLRNPLTPYINSDATARDMELLRQLLGEDKLNYVGYSYGTWLGSWYASLFPDRVGRMVLDSSFDFSSAIEKVFVAQPEARQRLHETVLLPYAARHNAYFQLGSNPADIAAKVQSISPQMRYALGAVLSGLSYSASSADTYLVTLGAALWLESALVQLADPADALVVATAARQYVFSADDHAYDQMARWQVQQLYNVYRGAFLSPSKSFDLGASAATYWVVRCNDDVATIDVPAWNKLVRSTTLHAPLYTELSNPCAHWGGPRVIKPSIAAMEKLDVLMVQSQYDAATPSDGADRFFAQLPNARRVYVPGEYQHGVFPYTDSCVDKTVVRYLLGEAPKERETSCQAHPLQQDKPVAPDPSSTAPATASRPAVRTAKTAEPSTAAPTYLNPDEAQKRIDRFKEGIGRQR